MVPRTLVTKCFCASIGCTNWHVLALRLGLALLEVGASPQIESHNEMLSARRVRREYQGLKDSDAQRLGGSENQTFRDSEAQTLWDLKA